MGFFDKFIPKEIKKPFKKAASFVRKITPRELRPALPFLSAAVPFMLPGSFALGSLNPALSRGIMSSLANIGTQQVMDPEGDINLLSAALAGATGYGSTPGVGENLRSGIMKNTMTGPDAGEFLAAGQDIPGVGFLQGAENIGREGLATAADYLSGSAEGIASLANNPENLFKKEGLKAIGKAIAVPAAQGSGDLAYAVGSKAMRDFEEANAAEEAEYGANEEARRLERYNAIRAGMEENDFTDEEIQVVFDRLGLGEYVPSESAAQGGIIGLKEGGSVNTPKRGLVNEPGGYAGVMPSIEDIWAAEGGDDPLGTIVKLGLTFRKPIVEIVNLIGATGSVAADLISSVAKLGYDVTEPIRDVVGSVASTGLDGIKFALGQTDKWRYAQRPYQALRMAGLDDTEARLSLQESRIGDFRKDPELIRALQSRLFEDKIGYGSDYQGGEVELYPGQSTKYAQGGIIGLKEGGMLNFGGREMDLRGGGFVPIGKKERADDVPARLSKNEFVMTADAVRAAGGGSVNKGAQRMYDVMNKLEARA